MKRIINRKRYDTETATEVLDISGPYSDRGNFRWDDTYLYVTKSGNWFISGRGGPMSRWRRQTGDGWCDGDGLVAISPDEAREELENRGTAKAMRMLEQYFADEITEA